MKPDINKLNNSPDYLRELVSKIGVSQNEAATMIGVSERSMHYSLTANGKQRAPYVVQFALERLAIDPSEEYEKWVGENTYTPHEAVKLQTEHNCNLLGAWRRHRRLTQTDLANKIGITEQTLVQMEIIDYSQNEVFDKAVVILDCDVNQLID